MMAHPYMGQKWQPIEPFVSMPGPWPMDAGTDGATVTFAVIDQKATTEHNLS